MTQILSYKLLLGNQRKCFQKKERDSLNISGEMKNSNRLENEKSVQESGWFRSTSWRRKIPNVDKSEILKLVMIGSDRISMHDTEEILHLAKWAKAFLPLETRASRDEKFGLSRLKSRIFRFVLNLVSKLVEILVSSRKIYIFCCFSVQIIQQSCHKKHLYVVQ